MECLQATDCKGTDGTLNTYCPKDSEVPNYVLPTCDPDTFTCQCAASCGTGGSANDKCAPDYCCTGQDPDGPTESPSSCVLKGAVSNPWLCT